MEWFGVTGLQVQRARDYLKSRGLVRVTKRWVTQGKNTRRHLACHYFPDWLRMIELVPPEANVSLRAPEASTSAPKTNPVTYDSATSAVDKEEDELDLMDLIRPAEINLGASPDDATDLT